MRVHQFIKPMKGPHKTLTQKQKEIIVFFRDDYDIPAIVAKTGIAYRTIERRVERARLVLGKKHPQGMVAEALRRGEITL